MQKYFNFMHKCRNYGPDKLIYVTFKCSLDSQLSKMVTPMSRFTACGLDKIEKLENDVHFRSF